MSKSQGRNGPEVKSKESKTIDKHEMEGGDIKKVRGSEQVKGIDEGCLEDHGNIGETGWHRGPGLRG